jgi:A/G-specific adenine glycosylase
MAPFGKTTFPGMSETPFPRDEASRAEFRRALLHFFQHNRRDLPWRRTPDPWGVLVSEIMLQQTRVDTVVPYYLRWMERFPTPMALADAPMEEVLRQWQGLGYYRRARNLHAAAQLLAERSDQGFPQTREELRALPGIGAYTAGAVASIAFGRAVPAVDGNVRRVFARLLDDPSPTLARLEREVGALVDPVSPGDFNQGLMELGSLVCTPRRPRCEVCPVQPWCAARGAGTVQERPQTKPKAPVRHLHEVVLVLRAPDGEGWQLLLRQRPESGLLGGLWEFPGLEIPPPKPGIAGLRLLEEGLNTLLTHLGIRPSHEEGDGRPSPPAPLPRVEHLFTHRKVTYHPHLLTLPAPSGGEGEPGNPLRWVTRSELDLLPLSQAQLRILGGAEAGFLE